MADQPGALSSNLRRMDYALLVLVVLTTAFGIVVLDGVTHTMKEEKLGPVRGFASRLVMYADIGRVLLGASRSRERRSSRKQPRAER